VNPDVGIIEIKFDSGKTLGYPAVVKQYGSLVPDFVGENRSYTEAEAKAIWKKFGLKGRGSEPTHAA
jgi:hypothetical protein